jgi:glycosyltransferase involved in cell wall biosynthesis
MKKNSKFSETEVLPPDTEPLRLTLVISSLGAGGAQRVLSTLANRWAEKGWRLTLLTLDDGLSPPFFPLHPQVRHNPMDLYAESSGFLAKFCNNFRRLFILRRAIAASRAQMVLCFMDRTNVLVLSAMLFSSVPVIVSERIHPAVSIGWIWEILRKLVYPGAAGIVVLTKRTLEAFPSSWKKKMVVIPNPVSVAIDCPFQERKRTKTNFTVISIGRLTEQKGFDLLIKAFSLLDGRYPDWNLLILGEGPQKSELEKLCRQLHVTEKVRLAGNVPKPEISLREADIFVLPSRFEGFPNVLCEAMACGLPVIATDCLAGPREIIRSGIDGLLVQAEDPDALARAMACLMDNGKLRRELGRRAERVADRFGLEKVDQKWERLFDEILGER